jgi:hypothetical protein
VAVTAITFPAGLAASFAETTGYGTRRPPVQRTEMFLRSFETLYPAALGKFSHTHSVEHIDIRSPQFYGALIP